MSVAGNIDVIKRFPGEATGAFYVLGWAADFGLIQVHQAVEIIIDDIVVGEVTGNLFRSDLAEAKVGDGTHGFQFCIPASFYDGNPHILKARFKATGLPLPQVFRVVMSNDRIESEQLPDNLVWAGKSFMLPSAARLDATTWLGAIQQNVIEMPFAPKFVLSAWEQAKPIWAICALLMVKNEEDIIWYNLIWLYYLGVRKFVVIDNNSSDATRWILDRFRASIPDVELLIVDDPIVRYIQSDKTTGIMRLAASVWRDCSWMIPVDADEFLIPQSGLKKLLEVPECIDAIVIPKCYHLLLKAKDEEAEYEKNIFKRMPIRTELHRAPPKVILRAKHNLIISQGNHRLAAVSGTPAPLYSSGKDIGFYYREFSIRSFFQFKQKVIDGGRAIELAEKQGLAVGGDHWKYRYHLYKLHGEQWLKEQFQADNIHIVSKDIIFDEFNFLPLIKHLQKSEIF